MISDALGSPASGQGLTLAPSSLGMQHSCWFGGGEAGRTWVEESGNSVGILFSGQNESCCSRTQIARQTSLKVTFALVKSVQWGKGERLSLFR